MKQKGTDLPDEVITTHILPRLPVKSIGRCRCVSKPWRSLLSSPEFAKTHLEFHADEPEDFIIQYHNHQAPQISTFTDEATAVSRTVNFPTFEAFTDTAVPKKVKLPLFQKLMYSKLVGSCDGLILLETDDMHFGAILVNPVTLEYVNLPEASLPGAKFRHYGLGYDSCSDDYKVVKLSESRECHHCFQRRVDVYSLKRKCWRRVGLTPFGTLIELGWRSGPFLNGCIHWMAVSESRLKIISIAAFDLAKEDFDQIPLPSGADVVDRRGLLGVEVFKGRLTLIHLECSRMATDVWVMEEYRVQDSWTKLATIKWPEDICMQDLYASCNTIGMLNEDEIIVGRSDSQLFAYNWKTAVWRDMVVAGYKRSPKGTIMTFKESILSLNSQIRA